MPGETYQTLKSKATKQAKKSGMSQSAAEKYGSARASQSAVQGGANTTGDFLGSNKGQVNETLKEIMRNIGGTGEGTYNYSAGLEEGIEGGSQAATQNVQDLAEARKKGALTRQKKAEAKRALKAEAKAIKDEEKRLRREATQERNRVKARERYRSQKVKKDEQSELKEKIRLESEAKKQQQEVEYKRYHSKPMPIPDPVGMNFEKFAGYMMRYEGLKQQYAQQQKQPPPISKQKSEFPEHYPLANLYKKNKNRKADFSNF